MHKRAASNDSSTVSLRSFAVDAEELGGVDGVDGAIGGGDGPGGISPQSVQSHSYYTAFDVGVVARSVGASTLGSGGDDDEVWEDPTALRDFTLLQAMATLDFWLHALAFLAAGGAGLVLINNIAQIVAARGAAPSDTDVFVSLISIANCAGRLVSGAASDAIQSCCARRGVTVPRPLFFAAAALTISVVHVVALLVRGVEILWFVVGSIGFAYGEWRSQRRPAGRV